MKLDGAMTVGDVRDLARHIAAHRPSDGPFDIVIGGETPGDDLATGVATVAAYQAAGTTWWIEGITP